MIPEQELQDLIDFGYISEEEAEIYRQVISAHSEYRRKQEKDVVNSLVN